MSVDFDHEALFYAGEVDFVEQASRFIADGVAAGEPTFVVVAGRKIAALKDALGGDADSVLFADMSDVGLNPARIIPAWRDFVSGHEERAVALRGVGEPIWAERSADELVECQRHESLLNVAFGDARSFRLLCPYDVTALPAPVLEEAYRSHPLVHLRGVLRPSDTYRGGDAAPPFETMLAPAPKHARSMVVAVDRLHAAREFIGASATAIGMSTERREDLMLAVTEVAVNSLRHGRGAPVLSVWDQGHVLLCQVADVGRIVASPLVGREQPPVDAEGGRGLWLANQLCDLVQVRALPSGTVVRLHHRAN